MVRDAEDVVAMSAERLQRKRNRSFSECTIQRCFVRAIQRSDVAVTGQFLSDWRKGQARICEELRMSNGPTEVDVEFIGSEGRQSDAASHREALSARGIPTPRAG